jgi:hypothetical protein
MSMVALGLGEDDHCQMRTETVGLPLQKMGNGGDRIVAVASVLVPASNARRAPLLANVSLLNLAIGSLP